MGLTALLDTPLFTGSATVSVNQGEWDVALDGRPYLIDRKANAHVHKSIQLLRGQSDQADEPGEQSINPEDFWRRSQHTWHHGAGQTHLDRGRETAVSPAESDRGRFRSSKGVNIWTENELSLMTDTDQKVSSANTNLYLCPAGSRLYLTDGATLKYTSDVTVDTPTFSTVTGVPTTAATSICSDGYNVWTAHGADGIYATTNATTSTAAYITDAVELVAYVK